MIYKKKIRAFCSKDESNTHFSVPDNQLFIRILRFRLLSLLLRAVLVLNKSVK